MVLVTAMPAGACSWCLFTAMVLAMAGLIPGHMLAFKWFGSNPSSSPQSLSLVILLCWASISQMLASACINTTSNINFKSHQQPPGHHQWLNSCQLICLGLGFHFNSGGSDSSSRHRMYIQLHQNCPLDPTTGPPCH